MKEYHICYTFSFLKTKKITPEVHFIFFDKNLNIIIKTKLTDGNIVFYNTNKTIFNITYNDIKKYLINFDASYYKIIDEFFTSLDNYNKNANKDIFTFDNILKISINHHKNIIRKLKIKKAWTI